MFIKHFFIKNFIQEQRLAYLQQEGEHQAEYRKKPYWVEGEAEINRIQSDLDSHVKTLQAWKESKKLTTEFIKDFQSLTAEQQSRFYSLRQTYHDDVLSKIKQSNDFNRNLFTQLEVKDTMRDILNGLLTLKYVDKTKMKGFDVAIQFLKKGQIDKGSISKIVQGVSDIENGLNQIAEDEMQVISREGIQIELVVTDGNNQCIVSSKKYPNVRKKIEDTGAQNFPENLKRELKDVSRSIAVEEFLDSAEESEDQKRENKEQGMTKENNNEHESTITKLRQRFANVQLQKELRAEDIQRELQNLHEALILLDGNDQSDRCRKILAGSTLEIQNVVLQKKAYITSKQGVTAWGIPLSRQSGFDEIIYSPQEVSDEIKAVIDRIDESKILSKILAENQGSIDIDPTFDNQEILHKINEGLEPQWGRFTSEQDKNAFQRRGRKILPRITLFIKDDSVTIKKGQESKKIFFSEQNLTDEIMKYCTEEVVDQDESLIIQDCLLKMREQRHRIGLLQEVDERMNVMNIKAWKEVLGALEKINIKDKNSWKLMGLRGSRDGEGNLVLTLYSNGQNSQVIEKAWKDINSTDGGIEKWMNDFKEKTMHDRMQEIEKFEAENPFKDDLLPELPAEEAKPDADRMGGPRATEPMKENGRKNKRMLALFNRFLDDWTYSMIKKVDGEYIYEDGGNVLDIHFPALLDAFDDPSVNDQRSKEILKKCKLQIRFQPNSNPPIYLLSIENTWGSRSKTFKFKPIDLSTKTELVSMISEAIQSVDEKHLLEEIVKEAKGTITIEKDVDPGLLKILRSGLESRKMYDEQGFHTETRRPKPGLNLRISSTMIKVLQEKSTVTKQYDVNKLIKDGFEIQQFVITYCTEIVPK